MRGRWSLYKEQGGGDKMIDKELLEILACPACYGEVELKKDKVICKRCGKKYPVRDGIPIMLIDEAE